MKHRLTNLAFLIWLIAVLILSVFPDNKVLTEGPLAFDRHGYFQHVLAYAAGMGIGYYSTIFDRRWKIGMVVLLWGIGLEAVQYWLPYRSFNVFDMLANVCGVLLGLFGAAILNKNISRAA
ncbi:VanZ family protein [Calditrichota bacterium LG25]